MRFLKYEFKNPTAWETAKAEIEITDSEGNVSYDPSKVVAVHYIGNLCDKWGEDAEGNPVCEILNPNICVDVIWTNDQLPSWETSIVWVKPCGVHIFAGWAEAYAKDYCEANPEAAYCQPPQPPIEL